MATVADRIVARLREAGVGHIFGMPGGGGNLDLIDAARRAGMPFVLAATETGGAIAAIAQAEITGRPGACLTTLGPGVASVVNGIACAKLDRVPLIVFTDSHPAPAAACTHQRLDHVALLTPVTNWSATLTADCAEASIVEALRRAAQMPPAGPVHLDCPGDVLSAAAPDHEPAVVDRARPSSAMPPAVADRLSTARKPLLLVGLGARRDASTAAIRRLCEIRRLPALVTYKAKGVVPDDHEWFGGLFTNGAIERPLVDGADLLIGVGLDPVELIPRPWTFPQPIVSCAESPMDNRHVPFEAEAIGDIPATLAQVEARLERSDWEVSVVQGSRASQRQGIADAATGLSPLAVVDVAARKLARAARVTVDAGAHMFPATIGWPAYEPNQMLISNGLSTMGFALPAAIGAALLDRNRPVVALTGDGGLLMCAGELATAVREELHIIVIVFADEALSLIKVKQLQRRLPERGVALGRVSWPAVAAGFGASAFSAGDEVQLGRALDQAITHRGPSVVEAKINPAQFVGTLRAVRG